MGKNLPESVIAQYRMDRDSRNAEFEKGHEKQGKPAQGVRIQANLVVLEQSSEVESPDLPRTSCSGVNQLAQYG